MSIDKKNADVNHQDHPHEEERKTTRLIHEFDGQRRSNMQKQSMSNMMQESEEQRRAGSWTER